MYGEVSLAHKDNVDFLNWLTEQETSGEDKFIIRSQINRNQAHIDSEIDRIRAEMRDYLDPNLSIYPNHTKDCHWDCWLRQVCLDHDSDGDWETSLNDLIADRDTLREDERWRNRLPLVA